MSNKNKTNISIIGANGYTGFELMRILSSHSGVNVLECVSRSNAGTPVTKMYPSLYAYEGVNFLDVNVARTIKSCDVAFVCLPHAASAEMCAQLLEGGIKVIDLSADFRYKNLDTYQNTYKVTHPCPQYLEKAIYGLPEINAADIAKAQLIANPGCYVTSALLPLIPLVKSGVIDAHDIIIDSKSGVSGAGRKSEPEYSFAELQGAFKAYAVSSHRHTSEISEKLSIAADAKISVQFTPHLLPVSRGILSTIYTKLSANVSADKIKEIYAKAYGNQPFVKVLYDALPDVKHVAGTNICSFGYKIDTKTNRLIIISALDNLIKGASGQAVQNLNLMLGYNQAQGLENTALYL